MGSTFLPLGSNRVNFEHCLRSYCLAIHILVQARLNLDARALIETVLKKNAGDSSKFLVVDSLLSCYSEEHGFSLNLVSLNTFIHVVEKSGKLLNYVEILDRIHGRRCSPSVIVNTSLVFKILEEGRVEEGAYCKEGRIDEAHCMMKDMEDMGLKPCEETYNSLVECYAKAGRLEGSLRNCEVMMEKGFVPSCAAFNEMVHKLCENGEAEKANAMLTRLLEKGFSPNEIAYASRIVGYEMKGDVEEVLKLFYEMVSKSISPGSSVCTTLIRSLCRSGKLEEAEKYLRIMKDRSPASSKRMFV
ncbi:hypothetical protein L484_019985 [Morus notabilis]|uniref:Pentacotripeptide-repeat region of PRORP domain-containing protein n=1 Tax=Morus notabilis TaxID=981085 RepID=W9R7N6_9ROSA|nr:hypothetical protein L484_019985 [Morus notabilis]